MININAIHLLRLFDVFSKSLAVRSATSKSFIRFFLKSRDEPLGYPLHWRTGNLRKQRELSIFLIFNRKCLTPHPQRECEDRPRVVSSWWPEVWGGDEQRPHGLRESCPTADSNWGWVLSTRSGDPLDNAAWSSVPVRDNFKDLGKKMVLLSAFDICVKCLNSPIPGNGA